MKREEDTRSRVIVDLEERARPQGDDEVGNQGKLCLVRHLALGVINIRILSQKEWPTTATPICLGSPQLPPRAPCELLALCMIRIVVLGNTGVPPLGEFVCWELRRIKPEGLIL